MKAGYYTDPQGNVLGYWELPQAPDNTEAYRFIESSERPPLYVSPDEEKAREIAEQRALLASTDYKIIRQTETQIMPEADFNALKLQRQAARDRINQLEQGA